MRILKRIFALIALILLSPLLLVWYTYHFFKQRFFDRPRETKNPSSTEMQNDEVHSVPLQTDGSGGQEDDLINPPMARLQIKDDSTTMVNISLDSINQAGHANIKNEMLKHSEITAFTGNISHAYDLHKVRSKEICPRCGSVTEQHYADFIYATQIASRVMHAPAGYFCTQCPMVIIDQDMLREGVAEKFEFRGTIGINNEDKEFHTFDTWNGEKTVYLLDENQGILGLSTTASISSAQALAKKQTSVALLSRKHQHKKSKMARQSRKKNRSSKHK